MGLTAIVWFGATATTGSGVVVSIGGVNIGEEGASCGETVLFRGIVVKKVVPFFT